MHYNYDYCKKLMYLIGNLTYKQQSSFLPFSCICKKYVIGLFNDCNKKIYLFLVYPIQRYNQEIEMYTKQI